MGKACYGRQWGLERTARLFEVNTAITRILKWTHRSKYRDYPHVEVDSELGVDILLRSMYIQANT